MSAPHGLLDSSTIVAIATPPGRGGVGIVRLSGSQALAVVRKIFPGTPAFQPRTAHYRVLHGPGGDRIDDALVTFFPAPGSYTGEDVVELAMHGSPVVLEWLVRTCVDHGAVPARAGEFTERAFLSGKLDLTGAEAVRDLIEAQTLVQATLAAEQMGGSIAAVVRPIKQSLLELIATLEAGIDFAEDDIDTLQADQLVSRIQALTPQLALLLDSFTHGRLLREGMRLAIVGEPNVGKSSLFNRLLQQERAIVTAAPGTTRDVIAERIVLDGIPVELLDTAGLRETEDEAERIGVSRSRQAMAEADAVLLVVDASKPVEAAPGDAYALLHGRPVIVVHNKVDLDTGTPSSCDTPGLEVDIRHAQADWPIVRTSAVSGEGLPQLRQALLNMATGGVQNTGNATLTNLRQREAVSRAHKALLSSEAAAAAATPHEMVLLNLYEALAALDELTGETTADDVLNLIFSTFCIGK